jgi:hypothetical protein
MDLKNLFNKGKKIVDERGGVDSLKEDAEELKDIATSKGSLADKAKEAATAVKDPGAPGGEGENHPQGQGAGRHQGQHKQQPPKQP